MNKLAKSFTTWSLWNSYNCFHQHCILAYIKWFPILIFRKRLFFQLWKWTFDTSMFLALYKYTRKYIWKEFYCDIFGPFQCALTLDLFHYFLHCYLLLLESVKKGVGALTLTIDVTWKFSFLPTFDYHLDSIPYTCV